MAIPKWITTLETEEQRSRALSIYVEHETAKEQAKRARESGLSEVERRFRLAMIDAQENYRDAKEELLTSTQIKPRADG